MEETFYPDVFDGLGFLPREYGAVQIFVEPVERNGFGRAVAEIWLQASFNPLPSEASVAVMAGEGATATELARLPLGDLSGGKVVRWRLPLMLEMGVERLCFQVSAVPPPEAARVRVNRSQDAANRGPRLNEIELTKGLSGADAIASSIVRTVALNAMVMPFGYVGVSYVRGSPGEQEFVSSPIGLPVEDMPHGFLANVIAGQPEQLDALQVDLMWEPGWPTLRPETAIRRRLGKKEQPRERTCFTCGASVLDDAVAGCPSCGSLL